jgi:hypothetical protein
MLKNFCCTQPERPDIFVPRIVKHAVQESKKNADFPRKMTRNMQAQYLQTLPEIAPWIGFPPLVAEFELQKEKQKNNEV